MRRFADEVLPGGSHRLKSRKYMKIRPLRDIMMPYFSGMELIDYVRNELKSNIPIIIISSAGNEENVLNAFELGANDFISKPVSPSELLVRVERELNKN